MSQYEKLFRRCNCCECCCTCTYETKGSSSSRTRIGIPLGDILRDLIELPQYRDSVKVVHDAYMQERASRLRLTPPITTPTTVIELPDSSDKNRHKENSAKRQKSAKVVALDMGTPGTKVPLIPRNVAISHHSFPDLLSKKVAKLSSTNKRTPVSATTTGNTSSSSNNNNNNNNTSGSKLKKFKKQVQSDCLPSFGRQHQLQQEQVCFLVLHR